MNKLIKLTASMLVATAISNTASAYTFYKCNDKNVKWSGEEITLRLAKISFPSTSSYTAALNDLVDDLNKKLAQIETKLREVDPDQFKVDPRLITTELVNTSGFIADAPPTPTIAVAMGTRISTYGRVAPKFSGEHSNVHPQPNRSRPR